MAFSFISQAVEPLGLGTEFFGLGYFLPPLLAWLVPVLYTSLGLS